MGCAGSVQTASLNKNQVKKINTFKKDDKDNKKPVQSQLLNSKKSTQENKNISSSKSLSKSNYKAPEKPNSNLYSSTKSLPKEEKHKVVLKTTGDSLRSSQKDLQINANKVNLQVKQILSQNEQDVENYTSEKKLKKMKKKKTGIDPKLGELLKVYGL